MHFWDYSVWDSLLQFGFLAVMLVLSNILIRNIRFLKNSLLPVSVLAGLVSLLLKELGVINFLTDDFLNTITYLAIMLGFIAMGLRVTKKNKERPSAKPLDSGVLIAANYLLQGAIGMTLAFIFIPEFLASGLLLPMGFGQGPGQANNIGMQYELMGFTSGQSFGLAISSAGFIWACIIGVVFMTIMQRKGKIKRIAQDDKITTKTTTFDIEDQGEIPASHSIDKFSVQLCLVLISAVLTFLVMYGIVYLCETFIGGSFVEKTVKPLIWGFNFIFGSIIATLISRSLGKLRNANIVQRQYQNNYLLNRIAGASFDFMIVASITAIEITELSSLILPLIIMTTVGAFATFFFNKFFCKHIFPDTPISETLGFYGMLTGTVSSGMILIREVDPNFETPAADSLVFGTSTAILFGFPILLLVGIAPEQPLLVYGCVWLLLATAIVFLLRKIIFRKKLK